MLTTAMKPEPEPQPESLVLRLVWSDLGLGLRLLPLLLLFSALVPFHLRSVSCLVLSLPICLVSVDPVLGPMRWSWVARVSANHQSG